MVHDVRSLQKLVGDLRGDRTNTSLCGLLLGKTAKEVSSEQIEIIRRLTQLDVEVLHSIPSYSQIHMPTQVAGISVLFAVPEESRVGVMKQLQDNVRGLEKRLKASEAKLESIRKNLRNPLFLQKASREVCEREKNNEQVVEENCNVLRKNVDELLSLIRDNIFYVC